MKLETLIEANRVASELNKWKDMQTRLSLGDGFFSMQFKASKNKTMFTEYDYYIRDEKTIGCFKKFVDSMIEKCEKEIKNM